MTTFKSLGISAQLVQGLEALGITKPTEIQIQAIPKLLKQAGDFIGLAQTGTGKTAAYGLPILQQIDLSNAKIQALILCPTRELGQQIAKQLFKFTKFTDKIYTEAVYGGEKIEEQISALRRPTHILVATPGRLLDLQRRKAVDLRYIKTVVLDEADEMLSVGFKKDLDLILEKTSATSNTWLFSATMPKEIQQLVHNYMDPAAIKIEVNKDQRVNVDIAHQYAICEERQKMEALTFFLKSHKEERGIIFCRTKKSTQEVHDQLIAKKYDVGCIHGDLKQIERDKVMRAFKGNKLKVLIATDISARGIDVNDLAYVFHYQLPDQVEYYTHRSGRTARAGKKGVSILLISPKEVKDMRNLARVLHIEFKQLQ
ncbi:MAG: DEAD/DEAH box helicase [Flammeovirgaceae bacterium]|nr:DEAD/DEAH box helicase [Flammeovirgaceae bacterium]